jgi:uncharacterized membrane protein
VQEYLPKGKTQIAADVLRWCAQQFTKVKALEKAEPVLALISASAEVTEGDWLQLAETRFELGKYQEAQSAIESYLKLVQHPVQKARGLLIRAKSELKQKRVEPAQKTYNKGHDTFIEKEKKGNSIQKVTLGIGLVLFLFFQTFHFNFIPFVFSILSIVGMTICFLTISHKHGKANVVTSRLCNNEKTHSCDLVLNSSAAEIIKGVDFGDVGLMYFSGLLLLSTFSQISQNSLDALSLLLIPCSIALALTFFTLYYQWKILKVWCKMCLLIVAVVWLQEATILILLVKTKQFISTSWPLFILQFSLSFSLTPIWLLIKPLLKAKMIEKEGIIGLLMSLS